MRSPCFDDVLAARERVRRYLPRTPVYPCPGLSRLLGCELFVKYENHLPTGAFKVRGGINLIAQLGPEERRRGVVTATRGNHGQSIAWAARRFGVPARIFVPHGNNPEKNDAMRAFGAELVVHGADFDEAREHAEAQVEREGLRYVHAANEPDLIAGVGTYALELFEDVPDLEAVLVPVGLGSGICGLSLVRAACSPATRVIGVQAERAPSVYLSWKEGRLVTTERADTFADGLATRVPAELTLGMIRTHVDDFLLVTEEAIAEAIRLLLRYTHNLAEGAGAAALAAARVRRDALAGCRVAVILSGGNLDLATLRRVLDVAS